MNISALRILKIFEQTEEKLCKDEVNDATSATAVHYSVGKEVRSAIEKIGGTIPKDLPTPEKAYSKLKKNSLTA